MTSDPEGGFEIVLATGSADPGGYILTASAGGQGTVVFGLELNAAVRPKESQALEFNVPPGIAYTSFNYLPIIFGN